MKRKTQDPDLNRSAPEEVNFNFKIPVGHHRSLKSEAAERGIFLQDLMLEILKKRERKRNQSAPFAAKST